jgi:glucosamine--fructose-6-phosphate aminotransferase (isomerizing)
MTASPATNPYLVDILDQPQAVEDTLKGLREQSIPAAYPAGLKNGTLRRVVLTGMGSSHHAFYPLQQALIFWGFDTYLVETSELIHHQAALLRADSLVVAASQSGQSAEIVALVEACDGRFPLLGVSNTPGSPLAERSAASVLTRAGLESTVSTKTYLVGLLAQAWLLPCLLGEDPNGVLDALEPAPAAIADYLSGWQLHVDALKARLDGVNDVFVVGRGDSLAAAETGGLIIKESTHLHGEGMSSAGFRHGPYEMVGPTSYVLVMEGDTFTAALNRRLVEDVRALGGKADLVSADAALEVFRLPRLHAAARPLFEILPVQMMTLAISELRGHIAGRFSHSGKITISE